MNFTYQIAERVYELALQATQEGYRATLDGQDYAVRILKDESGEMRLLVDDQVLTVYWAGDGTRCWVWLNGETYVLEKPATRIQRRTGDPAAEMSLRAPMPGQVIDVQVSEGDQVVPGQTLLILEAMKMEMRLQAPGPGQVARLHVAAGATVEKEQILIELR